MGSSAAPQKCVLLSSHGRPGSNKATDVSKANGIISNSNEQRALPSASGGSPPAPARLEDPATDSCTLAPPSLAAFRGEPSGSNESVAKCSGKRETVSGRFEFPRDCAYICARRSPNSLKTMAGGCRGTSWGWYTPK